MRRLRPCEPLPLQQRTFNPKARSQTALGRISSSIFVHARVCVCVCVCVEFLFLRKPPLQTVLYMRECRGPQAYHRSCGQRRPPTVSAKTYLLNTPKTSSEPRNPEYIQDMIVGRLLETPRVCQSMPVSSLHNSKR